MIWSTERPIHMLRTSAKEAFFDVMQFTDEHHNPSIRKEKNWKHLFTPAELKVYDSLCYAYRNGQDRIVTNLNTNHAFIITFERYVGDGLLPDGSGSHRIKQASKKRLFKEEK